MEKIILRQVFIWLIVISHVVLLGLILIGLGVYTLRDMTKAVEIAALITPILGISLGSAVKGLLSAERRARATRPVGASFVAIAVILPIVAGGFSAFFVLMGILQSPFMSLDGIKIGLGAIETSLGAAMGFIAKEIF